MSITGNDDEVLFECAVVGAALLAAQRVEFLLYGLVAHVQPQLNRRDKRFRHLTPENYLRGDPSDLRATLGQLAKEYGPEFLLSADDFELFVKNRNLIVHNYWRLSKARIRNGPVLENPIAFLLEFLHDCQRWEGILRGVLANMKLSAARSTGDEQQPAFTPEDLNYLDQYHQHVLTRLFRK